MKFLDEIVAKYPSIASLRSSGKSYEGRDMPILTLSKNDVVGGRKNAIFVDGGIHAREWISPAFVTWLINELVENYAAHPRYLDNIDWNIMPGKMQQILR